MNEGGEDSSHYSAMFQGNVFKLMAETKIVTFNTPVSIS